MSGVRTSVTLRLVNGSTGDPALLVDYPGRDDAILFDAGDNGALGNAELADLGAVFISHHHVDHFIGFDRIVRANLDSDKTVSVYGPEGTIRRVYDKIKCYEYPYFPFQQVVFKVHDVLPGSVRSASLECARRFPEPEVAEVDRTGPVIHDTADLCVEAAHADHTTPCLAFALAEKPGVFPDADRLAQGPARPGPWVSTALRLIRGGAQGDVRVKVGDADHALRELRAAYFTESPGVRVAYVTDTAWSEASRPALLRLARGASRLYCDSFYADAQRENAEKHRHMTATQAAEFAREAGVAELVLIHFAARYEGRYETLLEEARAVFPNTVAEIAAAAPKKPRPRANRS